MENDYCQVEIDNMVEDLLTLCRDKLKQVEIDFLFMCLELDRKLVRSERDTLVYMYENMRDMPGE